MFFLTAFPLGCDALNGPHSIYCFGSIWLEVGCNTMGESSPYKLSELELKALGNLKLRCMILTQMHITYFDNF